MTGKSSLTVIKILNCLLTQLFTCHLHSLPVPSASNTSDRKGLANSVHDDLFVIDELVRAMLADPGQPKVTCYKNLGHKKVNRYYMSTAKALFMAHGTFNKYWNLWLNTTKATRDALAELTQMDAWNAWVNLFPYLDPSEARASMVDYFRQCQANGESDPSQQPPIEEIFYSPTLMFPYVWRYGISLVFFFRSKSQ